MKSKTNACNSPTNSDKNLNFITSPKNTSLSRRNSYLKKLDLKPEIKQRIERNHQQCKQFFSYVSSEHIFTSIA